MQNINAYKISSLRIAYMFTIEPELDPASELLQEMLESELETAKALSAVALDEFNKCQEMVSVDFPQRLVPGIGSLPRCT